jgi:hypothetical protein
MEWSKNPPVLAETKIQTSGQQDCRRPPITTRTGSDATGNCSRRTAKTTWASLCSTRQSATFYDSPQDTVCIGSQSVSTCTGSRSSVTWTVRRSVPTLTGNRIAATWTGNKSYATWTRSCSAPTWTGNVDATTWTGSRDASMWAGSRSGSTWSGKRGLLVSLLLVGLWLPASLAVPKGKNSGI